MSRPRAGAVRAAVFLACFVPAAINGYLLVFPDTEDYLVTHKSAGEQPSPRELSRIAEAADDTRQATGGLRPLMPRPLAETLAITGLAAPVWLSPFGVLRRRPDLWWPASLFLAAYVGNSALIGLGGEVHDRYSTRLVWLAPLLAALLALRAAGPAEAKRSARHRPGAEDAPAEA